MRTLTLLSSLLFAAAASAQTMPATQPADPRLTNPNDRAFEVSPALADGPTAPDPFALVYTVGEQTPGNAATQYLASFILLAHRNELYGDDYNAVENATAATVDRDAAARVLASYATLLESVEPAFARPEAHWDVPWREQGFNALIPYLNEARHVANLLGFRIIFHGSSGDFASSLGDVRRTLALGRHVYDGEDAFLVSGLVGIGIESLGMRRLGQVAELPGAPNAYWPLMTWEVAADFPRWMQTERQSLYATFPQLEDPDSMTSQRWGEMITALGGIVDGGEEPDSPAQRLLATAKAAAMGQGMYPMAREYLKEHRGWDDARLDATEVYPVLAHYMTASYDDAWNDYVKLASLPLAEALPRMREQEGTFKSREWADTLVGLLMPSGTRALESVGRVKRLRVAYIAVEALRDHAAKHGRFPASLDEMDLPVPVDPFTNQPLTYTLDGDEAVLSAGPVREGDDRNAFTWHIRLRR